MEKLKQYAPYIIVGIVILYLIRKLGSTQTTLAPQTAFSESQQIDPLIEARTTAFNILGDLGLAETQANIERERNVLIDRAQRFDFALGSKALDIDLSKSKLLNEAILQEINVNFLQREQDRQLQQGAIDRYYSSRRTNDIGNIVSSVSQSLSNIFRPSGTIFGTPPTFPRF